MLPLTIFGDGHEDRVDGTRLNLGLELLESHTEMEWEEMLVIRPRTRS